MTWLYPHERDEGRTIVQRYMGPRPDMPMPKLHIEPEMEAYLHKRKLSFSAAKRNGWYPSDWVDGFDRIVIPCTNSLGIPYWQARSIDKWALPRYQSPRATRDDSIVLCWPHREAPRRGSVIVEGPMDALAVVPFGFIGVGLMGNQPPPIVISYIIHMLKDIFEPVLIVPDRDHLEMGPFVLAKLAEQGMRTRIVLPIKKDLGEMGYSARSALLRGAV